MKKVVILLLLFGATLNLEAQKKINLDTLNYDQLNLYKGKAEEMRKAGMIITLSGVGIAATGYIATAIWMDAGASGEGFQTIIPAVVGTVVCIPASLIGVPLWANGGSRKKKAELILQKFNLPPEKSMALGVGFTIRF